MRYLTLSILTLVCGNACFYSADPDRDRYYPCSDDQDCIAGYRCVAQLCTRTPEGPADASPDSWRTRAAILTPRIQAMVASVNDVLYLIGGYAGGDINQVESYDPATDESSSHAAMPTPRYDAACAAVGDSIYVFGGHGDRIEVEAYDTLVDAWISRSQSWTGREKATAVAVGNMIYVLGGLYQGATSALVEVYDTAGNSWTTPAPAMPVGRSDFGAVVVGDAIYVVGGNQGLAQVDKLDTTAGTWSTVNPMPTGRVTLTAVALGTRVFAIGGYVPTVANQGQVEMLDTTSGGWTAALAAMPTPVAFARGAAGGGHVFVVGTGSNQWQEYIPPE